MGRSPHLNTVEGLQRGIKVANKSAPERLELPSVRVLIALYNASEEGRTMTRNDLLLRLDGLGNSHTMAGTYTIIYRLIARGYISLSVKGRTGIVSLTLAGRNYVKAVERAIKRIRWNKL